MRTNWQVPALSLALALGACGKPQEPASALPDDLQRDLAAASAGSDLATATQSYKRARFVSTIEMSKAAQMSATEDMAGGSVGCSEGSLAPSSSAAAMAALTSATRARRAARGFP